MLGEASPVLEGLTAIVVLIATLGLGAAYSSRDSNAEVRQLLLAGLVLRVVGSIAYFILLETVYDGGDYRRYLTEGALSVASNDFGGAGYEITDRYSGRWWGTPSVSIVVSWLMRALGTAPLPLFVVFGGISFAAAALFVRAFQNAFPALSVRSYCAWVMLYPSLWFWPSPIGKDAIVLFGIALAFAGVIGNRGRRSIGMIVVGSTITAVVRPQYGIVLLAIVGAGILTGKRQVGGVLNKVMVLVVLVVGAGYLATVSTTFLGFDLLETSETVEWIEARGENTAYGGSAFQAASNPVTGVVNALLRPFPWEASGLLQFVSSLELLALWMLIWRRRKAVRAFLSRYWRYEPVWLSILFVLVLSAAIGMAVGNFGTLARQRVAVYPFLFIIAAGYPMVRAGAKNWGRRTSGAPTTLALRARA